MSEMETAPVLRTQKEINEDYSKLALQYGDKIFKIQLSQKEIEVLQAKMVELANEKAAPEAPALPEAQA